MLCEEKGATLKVIPINDDGEIMMDKFHQMVNERTKMIALVHISNSLGTVNPVREVIAEAKNRQIPVLLDGAQAIPHQSIDVRALDCDFYVFSGHKVFGPTGIGVLYARHEILVDMPPYQGGGDMIKSVRFDRTTYNDLPHKFEAGTPNIAGAVGLAAALDYVDEIGYSMIEAWENELLKAATEVLSQIEGLRIIGTAQNKASVISFDIEGIHPHDIGQFLDFEGVAVRTGHHCTQPIMDRFDIPATTRASFAFYNTMEEVERLAAGIVKTIKLFRGNA
jgi:cysteine desulfurase/selenocysteine lyase